MSSHPTVPRRVPCRPMLFPILSLLVLLSACTIPPAPPARNESHEIAAINEVLDAQGVAWNRGDIAGYMEGYWKSPELRFASGGNVNRGWQATFDRYMARYGSVPGAMGRLEFSDQTVELVAADTAIVHGAWKLVRETDTPSGLYTLVMKKIDGDWVIVSDTTTSAD